MTIVLWKLVYAAFHISYSLRVAFAILCQFLVFLQSKSKIVAHMVPRKNQNILCKFSFQNLMLLNCFRKLWNMSITFWQCWMCQLQRPINIKTMYLKKINLFQGQKGSNFEFMTFKYALKNYLLTISMSQLQRPINIKTK